MDGNAVPLLSVKKIYKSFGSNAVLKGVDLNVYPGDVLALIGGNGAGKSTLVKTIMGINRPESGDILVDGKPIHFGSPSASLHAEYILYRRSRCFFQI